MSRKFSEEQLRGMIEAIRGSGRLPEEGHPRYQMYRGIVPTRKADFSQGIVVQPKGGKKKGYNE